MAERREQVIIEADIDVDESVESINRLRAANKELTAERNKLNIATEEGRKRAAEINVQIDANTNKIKANSSSLEKQRFNVGNYTASIVEASKQIKALEEENKRLAVAIRTVDKSTEEGKQQYNELNQAIQNNITQINVYNTTIAKTTTSSEKAAAGLKQLAPAATATAQGFIGMAKAALAFIATPIGAVIAALSVAFTVLGKFLFGTQEGIDKITAVTRPLMAIFDRLIGVVQQLGGRLFKGLAEAIQNPIQALKDLGNAIVENVLNRFKALELVGPAIAKIFSGDLVEGFKDLGNAAIQGVAGVENGIDKLSNLANGLSDVVEQAYLDGQRLDELQKSIERGEISRIVRSKELELIEKRNKAIVEDETKSFTEREAAALRARQAQNENERISLALLDQRIEKIKIQQALNDTSREDEKELAELQAQRLETQAVATDRAIEFDKKINELRKKRLEQEKLDDADARARARAENIESTDVADPLIGQFQTRAKVIGDIDKRMKDELKERQREYNEFQVDQARKTAQLEIEVERSKLQIIGGLTSTLAGLVREDSVAHKALASAQALINTYLAATAALASGSEINPVFGILAAATAVANGLASVARINGVEFAEGGYTGPGPKNKPAGVVHAGEVVWNQDDVKSVGGPAIANAMRPTAKRMHAPSYGRYLDGGVVTTSISQPINQQLELLNIVKNMPQPIVGVREITKVQKRVTVKEQISKR